MIEIQQGDCLDRLKHIPDNSISAVVTDPPYGLSFMGKKWDYDVPRIEIWQECLRVLKPGGYLLAFAGTRTQHRMACRIEDAGFEIRDMIMWVYGSGFPKSLNIGKAVDERLGNDREVIKTGNTIPDIRANNYENSQGKTRLEETVTKGNSEWEGWGTALKPACEPITVARKPLEGTVAENVLQWGVGGINIDGCRVETETARPLRETHPLRDDVEYNPNSLNRRVNGSLQSSKSIGETTQGRFPANFIHDGSDEVVSLFPHQKSGAMTKSYEYQNNGFSLGKPTGSTKQLHESSEGSAAHFFYCAKASKSERNFGLDNQEDKYLAQGNQAKAELARGNIEFAGESGFNTVKTVKNPHPTVKPIALMRYLCRLVTPKGGLVLDPFVGSGTTGIAAKLEGFEFIGIEREGDYVNIAKARIEAWKGEQPELTNQLQLFQ